NESHLEVLSKYLEKVGILIKGEDGAIRIKKAILLLELADDISQTFSFERMDKRTALSKRLQEEE
ncbi:MAG: hypothetical protein AAFR59_17590, partial [Bacteroidota bacterium]